MGSEARKSTRRSRLQELSVRAKHLAAALDVLAEEEQTLLAAGDAIEANKPLTAAHIRQVLRLRRQRAERFGEGLFADPAWDMLLDLMAARLDDRRVSISSLCIASAVPPTTALRWAHTLSERGLIVRREDETDRRRVFIELTDATAAAMEAYLRGARRGAVQSV
jgi:DNA-binding MarR family transcriptional regulator